MKRVGAKKRARGLLPVVAAVLATFAATAALAPSAQAQAQQPTLQAGVGRADITPRTGYILGGWVRQDTTGNGQHTRLNANALVLRRGDRKVALVAVELFAVPAGLLKHAAELAGRGFSERNVLASASHTHSAPYGFANFPTYNTAAPSFPTVTADPLTAPQQFADFFAPKPADPQLYTFLVRQLAAALRRADDDLGPAGAAWGASKIEDLTENRSIEAHLANHGITLRRGQGRPEQDPEGVPHTLAPQVNVLRVDKLKRRRVCRRRRGSRRRRCVRRRVRVPIGAWSVFANHGTVTKASFEFYNGDHHASAVRVFEHRIRQAAKVGRSQQIINVYGNGDEGDQSAGLRYSGPAGSDRVGRREAVAMITAWKQAGRRGLWRTPPLDVRWTRVCFCGQTTSAGKVADSPEAGVPFLTGSEENRGPLFDITKRQLEGSRGPVGFESQGHKIGIPVGDGVPNAVPLLAVRIGTRMIVSLPGEATAEVGRRTRAMVARKVAGAGVKRVVLSGLANEYIQYLTTPEEYDRQHYEGGSTLWGPAAPVLLQEQLAELGRRLVRGLPAQPAYPFDPTNGVEPNGAPYPAGDVSPGLSDQPAPRYRRLQRATIGWKGSPLGLDRPLDRAFLSAERLTRRGWRPAATDLGLQFLWRVDQSGEYTAQWEIPHTAPRGTYRLVVSANRYRLVSRSFRVTRSVQLAVRPTGSAVSLLYPAARENVDITFKPTEARGGVVHFRVGSRTVTRRVERGSPFLIPAGSPVTVPAGAAADRYGNVNGRAVTLRR